MKNKLAVKILVEVEYDLNDDKSYDLITSLEQSIDNNMRKILQCSSDDGPEHATADLKTWSYSISSEDI